jgi:hypothetical protein
MAPVSDASSKRLAICDWEASLDRAKKLLDSPGSSIYRPPSAYAVVALSKPEGLSQMMQILEDCKSQCDDLEEGYTGRLEDARQHDLEEFMGDEAHVLTLKDQTHGLPQCFAPLHPSSLEYDGVFE